MHVRQSIRILSTIAAIALFGTSSLAATGRTFVANNGTDAGACTAQAPCLTFAYALTQTAYAGEVVVLTPGEYGPVTITQSVSIVNDGVGTASITPPSGGDQAGTNDVVQLRGIEVNGANSATIGVGIGTAGELDIVNCIIENFTYAGIFTDSQYTSTQLLGFVYGSVLSNDGIGASLASDNVQLNFIFVDDNITGNTTESNPNLSDPTGIVFMPSTSTPSATSTLIVKCCTINGNGAAITNAEAYNDNIFVSDSEIDFNNSGLGMTVGTAYLDRTMVFGNNFGLFNGNGSGNLIISYENNDVVANTTNTSGTIARQAPY